MTDILFESRRDLRERAFQALMSLEYEGDVVEACRFAFTHDKEETDQEITSFDTPQLVAVNEAIELAKTFSDEKSARFVNGVLSQFVTEAE